ncbi:hypothetical protein Btru_057901 [Bulinus truncatus]|nr:hypothetical protein Btru_057901 [Bulinus truncatus]
MSELEETVTNETQVVDSASEEKKDESGQDQEQTTVSSPTDDAVNEEVHAGAPREDNEHRSTMTTPEVPVAYDDSPGEAEGLGGEDESDDHTLAREAANTPVATEGNAETGPAGSTPWPYDATDPQLDGGDAVQDPVEVHIEQRPRSASPHEDDSPENENEPTGQNELLGTDREGGVTPHAIISNVTPTFENFGGSHYVTGTFSRKPLPLTINRAAIENSARNKLPLAEAQGKVVRLGRHTEASSQKIKKWYKGDTYVDKDSYSWRNMALFDDFQRHLYTPAGSVRTSFKK